ncbi:uncharacterized protein MAM_07635 [Metarhizium album ARSEF 1941]|uniref:Hydrophobin n=1 Tax=Metarhizium album (strain ARSEF 1941) TaxID=1081103 RepID=A0A0B2WNK1_METAS|nr:uncharacterized protein MAM_07635 [Metarhizium album ARSEF 1941]KHN94580.1 hypothetical protein MAM_07635 [Metarhizium album ARSEF 1941]
MKFTAAILALAATAVAVPTGHYGEPGGHGQGQGHGGVCNNNDRSNKVCCSGIIAGVLCNIDIVGGNCNGGSYCCKSAPQGGLINIGLDCLKLQ